ncbi:MAG: hypothetical protein FGM18_06320 [Burkholderiaceae bacterium]|nr:hypothetical protein [Burkholderiaceae bacterium]
MSLRSPLLLISLAVSIALTGCATQRAPQSAPRLETPPPQQTGLKLEDGVLRLDNPNEQIRLAHSGRFVIQATSREQPDTSRGGQGRFEWLSITPAGASDVRGERQVVIWVGPLGQTLGSLERRLKPSNTSLLLNMGAEIRAFNAEGLMLNTADQQRMLMSLFGTEAARFNETDINQTLTLLMLSIEQMSRSEDGPREFRFRIHQTDIMLRAVLDPT